MKCKKCGKEHDGSFGSGDFCSRACANSRIFSEESKKKKSDALKGKPSNNTPLSKESRDRMSQRIKDLRLKKYQETTFEDLGIENKRRRVFEEQDFRCNRCKLKEWQGQPLPLELDHKDGDSTNNARDNLEGLCPNCHAITPTWRGRNKGNYTVS